MTGIISITGAFTIISRKIISGKLRNTRILGLDGPIHMQKKGSTR